MTAWLHGMCEQTACLHEVLLHGRTWLHARMAWPHDSHDQHDPHDPHDPHAGDMGRVETSKEVRQMAVNVTFLTHWGLYEDQPRGDWPKSHRPGKVSWSGLTRPVSLG